VIHRLYLTDIIVAKDKTVKNSQSIAGNSDMTVFEIIEILLTKSGSSGKMLPFKHDKVQH
jgi:hypothetical protein